MAGNRETYSHHGAVAGYPKSRWNFSAFDERQKISITGKRYILWWANLFPEDRIAIECYTMVGALSGASCYWYDAPIINTKLSKKGGIDSKNQQPPFLCFSLKIYRITLAPLPPSPKCKSLLRCRSFHRCWHPPANIFVDRQDCSRQISGGI